MTATLETTRVTDTSSRRRRLEEQAVALRAFDGRLSDEIRVARRTPGRADRVRELLSRLLGVRARLQETEAAAARAAVDEETERAAAREEEARREEARRAAEEREAFHRACLEAPLAGR
ncbi:hypothetical protein [Actinomycetospora aeridis]|uniref:Uncharacterized protein n=1 Tax=Actinomycetospora aeridis TaxID=3129231 RepID=A0ABU8N7L0_9PSEU